MSALLVVVLSALVTATHRVLVLHARVRALERLAITDPLTGAFNRRHMREMLFTAVERHRRFGDRASLLMIDIDRFKALNEAGGHAFGDHVLRSVADAVRRRLRRVDALFRFGGDEFVVLLAGTRLRDARAVAEQLRTAVEAVNPGAGRRASISVGIAELGDEESAEEWMAGADAALFEAKRSGRNCVGLRGVVHAVRRAAACGILPLS